MKNLKKLFVTPLLLVLAHLSLSGYSSCDPIIENNGFDLWCGEELCYWKLESGAIERVPTWHNGDFGVSFVGSDVRISQVNDFSSNNVGCLRFSLVADVDVTADVVLQLDLYDDGIIDYEQPIPATDWAPVEYEVNLPNRYNGVRFIVHKRGTGHAVIAQIYADDVADCSGAPLGLSELPSGGACDVPADCESQICTDDADLFGEFRVCGECFNDGDCGGDVCGAESPDNPLYELYRGCGPAGRHELGERCIVDGECATGVCVGGICSTCTDSADCNSGEVCANPDAPSGVEFWVKPAQCSPGGGLRATNEACLVDADCSSGSCTGTGPLQVCQIDGRLCNGEADCPGSLECISVGTAGGTCE